MRVYLVTDPAINAVVGRFQAKSQLAALNMAVGFQGWDSYRQYLLHCMTCRKANPGFGYRSLKAEPVIVQAKSDLKLMLMAA